MNSQPEFDKHGSNPDATRSLEETLSILRHHFPQLSIRYRVKSLGVFGSHVRGEAVPGSDLDILVEFDETPTLFEFVRLQRDLSEILNANVDLVMRSGLRPSIGKRILAEVVPV